MEEISDLDRMPRTRLCSPLALRPPGIYQSSFAAVIFKQVFLSEAGSQGPASDVLMQKLMWPQKKHFQCAELKIMIIFVFGFIIHFLSDQKLLPAGMMTGAEMTEKEAILNLPELVYKKYVSNYCSQVICRVMAYI